MVGQYTFDPAEVVTSYNALNWWTTHKGRSEKKIGMRGWRGLNFFSVQRLHGFRQHALWHCKSSNFKLALEAVCY